MSEPFHILILCTGNSARSILAEAAFNHLGGGRVRAQSAGSRPTGKPHPLALGLVAGKGIDTGFARSKSWDEFAGPLAPRMDLVITVCDSAAAEDCPFWPGAPLRAHWGLPDPAAVSGSDAERAAAFARTWSALERRVRAFLDLPFETLGAPALKLHLGAIGTAPD